MDLKIQDTIDVFVDWFTEIHHDDKISIKGILVFGSSLHPEKMGSNADLDLYFVIENNGKRYRGVKFINGTEVDYFANPKEQLLLDFNSAKNSARKTIFFMLANGKILKDWEGLLGELQKEAMKILEAEKNKEIPAWLFVNSKYFIDDYLKDIEDDLRSNNYFSMDCNFRLLTGDLLEIFCRQKKILIGKPKYQKEEIEKVDKEFIKLYEEMAMESNYAIKLEKIKRLSNYVIESLGGALPKDWELVSSLTI